MRALAFVPALRRAGYSADVWAGGAALPALRALGDVTAIETVGPGPRLGRRVLARAGGDLARLLADRPRVLVSDGDAPSTLAAKSLGIPVVAVGHGLLFAYADAGPLPAQLAVREALNALSSSLVSDRQVVVHFADARPRWARASLARMEVRDGLDRDRPLSGEIVAYFRDGGGDAWLEALADRGFRVRLFAARADAGPRGVVVEPPSLERFTEALSRASGVVGTAGSNLVAECRFLGVPLLALPAADDVEQRLNAILAARDRRYGPLVEGRLEAPSERAIEAFANAVRRVGREGRRPDGLPDVPGVAEAVVAAVRSLAGP